MTEPKKSRKEFSIGESLRRGLVQHMLKVGVKDEKKSGIVSCYIV